MPKYLVTSTPGARDDVNREDFLLERNPRFRKMLGAAARKPGGLTPEAYRKKRKL